MVLVPRCARFEVGFREPCQVIDDVVFESDPSVAGGGSSTDVAARRDPVR